MRAHPNKTASRLSKTRRGVAALRAALREPSPERLQEQAPELAAAAECLSWLTHPAPEEAVDLCALKRDLDACRKLIESGLAAAGTLAGILAAGSGGYSPTGGPGPLTAQARISLEA
jgi:hypothetical protein